MDVDVLTVSYFVESLRCPEIISNVCVTAEKAHDFGTGGDVVVSIYPHSCLFIFIFQLHWKDVLL